MGIVFFRIICNEKNNEKLEKLIVVETKGKDNDYFEQLEQSFDLLQGLGFKGNIHGRFIGSNVPSSVNFIKLYGKKLNRLQSKFNNGTIRFGNRIIWEDIKNCYETELKTQIENLKPQKIKL